LSVVVVSSVFYHAVAFPPSSSVAVLREPQRQLLFEQLR
jgi:hypothetical protein